MAFGQKGALYFMGKYLGVGNAGFTAIRKGTYIDKTGLISFVNRTLGTMQMSCFCPKGLLQCRPWSLN